MWPEIALIGTYPPPYGGISVHLQRLASRLEAAGKDFVLYNTISDSDRLPRVETVVRRKHWWFLRFCLLHRCEIVHLVSTNWMARLAVGMTALIRGGRYVISIHGRSISVALEGSPIRAALTRWLLRRMDVVIACNAEIARECVEEVGLEPDSVRHIPAFIPSDASDATLPEDIREFVGRHDPLLYWVGWAGLTYEGADVYGSDLAIELIERLRGTYPRIGAVLGVIGGSQASVEDLLQRCEGLAEHILPVTRPLDDVTPLMRASTLFLRLTNTDGDAVSIREALSVGTPVIASDAVPRPAPCVLFRQRDMDDLERSVRDALSDLDEVHQRVAQFRMPDNAAAIMAVYADLRKRDR